MSSLVFLPAALCWWALKNNNNNNLKLQFIHNVDGNRQKNVENVSNVTKTLPDRQHTNGRFYT